MLYSPCIAAFIVFSPAAHAASAEQMEANKTVVAEFYEPAINKKDFEAADNRQLYRVLDVSTVRRQREENSLKRIR